MNEPKKLDTNCPKTNTKPTETPHKQYQTKPKVTKKPDKKYRYNKRQFGRPSKYKPIYCVKIVEYFDREHTVEYEETHTNRKGETWTASKLRANPVPTLQGFSASIGVTVSTLWEWKQQHADFSKAYSRAQALQLDHLNTVAGLGLYNSNWAVFMAKNVSEWRDKKDIEHSGTLDSTVFVEAMIDKSAEAEQDELSIRGRLN